MKRLTRTTRDRKLGGVCGGLGEYFNVDPTVVRIVSVILLIPFSAAVLLLYAAGIVLMPNDTEVNEP
ncbi:PspC domain-containing protein [Alkalicoccus chagannorensis]|uniref:PspC domain-containing protein n=1 Tax=Alkalicoccus chagannorensis TaxID=427072 RepID=UPI0004075DF1|nr:PspC domain-containing protein [Alkalicoccus chagannorensis]